jgi:hypothetical protein
VSLAVGAVSALGPVSANAASIVYTKDDGNVWLADPASSKRYEVTHNGTSANPYKYPSQADDGTIVAARGDGHGDVLVRMSRTGKVLNTFQPPIMWDGLKDVAIAPDGKRIAYVTDFAGNSTCSGRGFSKYCYVLGVTNANGGQNLGHQVFREAPMWLSNSRLLVQTDVQRMATYTVGAPGSVDWFGNGFNDGGWDDPLYGGDVTKAGDKIATTAWHATSADPNFAMNALVLWTTNGAPPSGPTPRCVFSGPAGGNFLHPTWSPSGSGLAWEESDDDPSTKAGTQQGIWIVNSVPANFGTNCGGLSSRLLAPGGYSPDWGPANVPAPDTTAPNTTIVSGPASGSTSHDPTPTFSFRSSEAGSTFLCRVDATAFSKCVSPKTLGPLANGAHTFRVKAVDRAGNADATPATRKWTVKR